MELSNMTRVGVAGYPAACSMCCRRVDAGVAVPGPGMALSWQGCTTGARRLSPAMHGHAQNWLVCAQPHGPVGSRCRPVVFGAVRLLQLRRIPAEITRRSQRLPSWSCRDGGCHGGEKVPVRFRIRDSKRKHARRHLISLCMCGVALLACESWRPAPALASPGPARPPDPRTGPAGIPGHPRHTARSHSRTETRQTRPRQTSRLEEPAPGHPSRRGQGRHQEDDAGNHAKPGRLNAKLSQGARNRQGGCGSRRLFQ
jgi:hypothetical protein